MQIDLLICSVSGCTKPAWYNRISSNISVPEIAADRTAATAAHCSCFICSLISINWCDPNQPIAMLFKFSSISKREPLSIFINTTNNVEIQAMRHSNGLNGTWRQVDKTHEFESLQSVFVQWFYLFCYETLTSLIHIHFWFPLFFYASCSTLFYLFQLKKHLILMPVLT